MNEFGLKEDDFVSLEHYKNYKKLLFEHARMKETLEFAAGWFRKYEEGHAAKNTSDGNEKAQRNAMLAQMCEDAIKE